MVWVPHATYKLTMVYSFIYKVPGTIWGSLVLIAVNLPRSLILWEIFLNGKPLSVSVNGSQKDAVSEEED